MIEARLTDANFHELGILKIASPCAEPWDSMRGDDRVRRCDLCKLNVYNLEEMTTEEARQLIRRRSQGRICARFYRRFDGTVLTKDCKRGFDYGWVRARALLPGVGWLTFALAVLVAGVLGVVALFGDNYRRLQASAGDLGGNERIEMRPKGNRF